MENIAISRKLRILCAGVGYNILFPLLPSQLCDTILYSEEQWRYEREQGSNEEDDL